ncbi:MAG: hypothetical protein DMG19_17605 [Acidobacteria bacterium]|nr:MAG: hypothetical protein DMG19_17605 [Acidobacteriota bacterium]
MKTSAPTACYSIATHLKWWHSSLGQPSTGSVPISRGILNTITLRTQDRISAHSVLAEIYAKTPFVQVLSPGQLPNVHSVTKTNLCVIGTVARGDNTVIVSVLDNLVKGAAGQAVQNLNLMFGYEPTAGLVS